MRRLSSAVAAVLALSATPAMAAIEQAEVTGGTVAGEVTADLSMFKGIPFAAPPTGDLRWAPPAPVIPWMGVRQADRFGAACMQGFDMLRQQGSPAAMSEDCLYLDVWTPAKSAAEKLPVIVWIHGGGYTMGATSVGLYDGANFARDGVVFVSVAYRLGSFGFLATPELSAATGKSSGNAGMLDMIQALRWVQDNIAQFGGDKDNVTIMGHSAGSSAVSILTASSLTRGMIDAVIAESGANFAPLASGGGADGQSLASAESAGQAWLQSLGAPTLTEARSLPAATLLERQSGPGAPGWRPATDGYVLTDEQYALWQQGKFNDIPLLLGNTSNEWGASARGRSDDFAGMVRRQYGEYADRILAAYEASGDKAAAQLANESGMESNSYTWAKLHHQYGESPIYYYWFNNAENGSGHGSEVGLVFANEDNRPGRAGWDDRTRALSNQLHSYWVNFAKNHDPNGAGLPAWPRWTPDKPSVLAVGLETRVRDVAGRDRLDVLADYFDWRRAQAARK